MGDFEHTGIKHILSKDFSVYTHQNHYVTEISEISLTDINTTDPQSALADDLLTLFWSLLGALSWLQQTRADIAPFIGYLQRVAHIPTIAHVKMANKLLRYVRRVKCGLRFTRLTPPLKMVTVADSAYKADDGLTECIALRGCIILIVGQHTTRNTGNSVSSSGHFPGGLVP